ncbi:MAG: DUF4831 family protein [Bacteroidales bacterium]
MKTRYTKAVLFTLLILFAFSCSVFKKAEVSKATIKPYSDTTALFDGSLVYALPMTVLTVNVELEKTIERAGPYSRFAGDLLGIKDIITKDKETWEIKSISISSMQEPDPSEYYIIESSSIFRSNALALRNSGLILDLNPVNTQPAIVYNSGNQTRQPGETGFHDLGSDEYFMAQSDTAYRVVKLDTTFVKIPYLVEKKKQLTIEQLADKAAKTILELRDGKQMLLTGETNVYPQDAAGINELNRLEDEYTALFVGKVAKDKKLLSFTVVPRKEQPTIELFRFSRSDGPSDKQGGTGDPVVLELKNAEKSRDFTYITRPVDKNEKQKKEEYDKIYYRLPESVIITCKTSKTQLFETRRLVYQFGQIVQLPSNFIIGKN